MFDATALLTAADRLVARRSGQGPLNGPGVSTATVANTEQSPNPQIADKTRQRVRKVSRNCALPERQTAPTSLPMVTLTQADITARIARNIKLARDLRGLSQPGLADLLPPSIRKNEISRWENGSHRPREYTLIQIARALELDVGWFYAEHDTP